MTPAARLSAAIEVLAEIFNRHQPSLLALKEWGRTHRFAGSSDRAIIGNLVFDVLRRKGSLAWLMHSEEPRALVLALYAKFWSTVENLDQLCTGENHAPPPLTEGERANLLRDFAGAPPHVRGFYPEWLDNRLAAIYGEARMEEGMALAERAPVDLRVNTLKTTRDKVLEQLGRFKPTACKYSPVAVRIAYGSAEARSPHVEAEGIFQRGHIELQDEGSQIAGILVNAAAGMQVLDLCAGSGGKTLALSALMQNKGQIIATDSDRHRLAPIYERLKRADAHNVQVREYEGLNEFRNRMDRVVLDAPCTGSGAWRRRPDNKWRLSEKHIADRAVQQDMVLASGADFVRPGGELIYITCSILGDENEDRIQSFLNSEAGQNFTLIDLNKRWQDLFSGEPPRQPGRPLGFRLSPKSSDTDGFFITALQKRD